MMPSGKCRLENRPRLIPLPGPGAEGHIYFYGSKGTFRHGLYVKNKRGREEVMGKKREEKDLKGLNPSWFSSDSWELEPWLLQQ